VGVFVGTFVAGLALLVGVAGWRLGATNRGLAVLAVATALGIGGRIAGVEEFVLLAVALGVLLAVGPIVLWHRAERSTASMQIELRPSAHEFPEGGSALLTATVVNIGARSSAPMRLESADAMWKLSRPGIRQRQVGAGEATKTATSQAGPRRSRGWRGRVAAAVRVPALASGERAEIDFFVPDDRRGVLTLKGLRLWCTDAFELFAYEIATSTEASVVVVPRTAPPKDVVQGILQPAGRLVWSPPASGEATGGQGFDLSGLRPYVPGDRLRLLHWPTLARTGDLVVRDFEGSGTDAVTVIMDDRHGVVGPADFESIVRTTAGVGREAQRLNLGFELRSPGGVNLDLPSGPLLHRALVRLLATVDLVPAREGAAQAGALGLKRSDSDDLHAEKVRIVVTSASACATLPEVLRRSSTVVIA
jgi:uncharacterized protein (DUF58 family)